MANDQGKIIEKKTNDNCSDGNDQTALMNAITARLSLEKIQEILRFGTNVNSRDSRGMTPLMYAALVSDASIIRELLMAGSRVDDQDNSGKTALMMSCENTNTDVFFELKKAGADIFKKNKARQTVLMFAAAYAKDIRVTQYLLDQGMFIDDKDSQGTTALMFSFQNENHEITRSLLAKNANLHAVDNDGNSVLMYAAGFSSDEDIITLLIAQGLPIDGKNKKGWTPICFSACNSNVKIIERFVQAGANVHYKTKDDVNALMIAAVNNQNSDMFLELINLGCNLNNKDTSGWNALMYAVNANQNPDIVMVMLGKMNNDALLQRTKDRVSLLALSLNNKNPEIAKLLLRLGADPTSPNGGASESFPSTVELACKMGVSNEVIRTMWDASLSYHISKVRLKRSLRFLEKNGADVKEFEYYRNSYNQYIMDQTK